MFSPWSWPLFILLLLSPLNPFILNWLGLALLPLIINYLLGKDKKHYFEIGGGVTPVFNSINANPEGDSAITETFAHLVLGYRFQPINKGFTFRAFMCPIYGNGIFIPYYAGISGGYKF